LSGSLKKQSEKTMLKTAMRAVPRLERFLKVLRQTSPLRIKALALLVFVPALVWGGSALNISPAPAISSTQSSLLGLFGKKDELLPPELAFDVSIVIKNQQTLLANFKPAEGYYLYRDKFSFDLEGIPTAGISGISMPEGTPKEDAFFGTSEVYYEPFQAELAVTDHSADLRTATLNIGYQGCSESGVCYPPVDKSIILSSVPVLDVADADAVEGGLSESGRIGQLLEGGNLWLIAASFLGFGLLLSFTPCMLPMIPILSGIIVKQDAKTSRSRSVILSITFVLGMAITYAIAGVAAGLSGIMVAATLQSPWILGTFALLFVVLSLSMFGLYELQVPVSLQNRIARTSNRLQGGGLGSVFGMGALSAIIVGPCVAAPLAGAMLYISQTQDVVLGGAALFMLAIGMGIPLVLIGASAGTLLPRAGAWMEKVKVFFGVLLLGTAVWIVSPVIPAAVTMLLWGGLAIASAVLLWGRGITSGQRRRIYFQRTLASVFLVLGIGLVTSVATGGRDILQPFAHLNTGAPAAAQPLEFEYINSVADLDARLEGARGQYVMLDFYADWCVSCKEMDAFVFSDDRVKKKLREAVLLKADVTAVTAEHQALLKRFGLFGPPGTLFFDKQGRLLKGTEVVGYLEADKFLAHLNKVMR
jgi:thiol:disulfide interchange protein DsbD